MTQPLSTPHTQARQPLTWLRASLIASALCCSQALAQRVPMPLGDGPFGDQGLLRGVSATAADCARLPSAVWATLADGRGECIRYWAAGLDASSATATGPRRVLVYLPPDQMAFDQPDAGYAQRTPAQLQTLATQMQREAGVPFILLARPGIFGSSGEHRQRRREEEPRLVSAALDALARRHGITEWVLSGLSGGGHIVASLLGWRSDIVCAVAASAVSSPRLRWQTQGRDRDLTGHADSHEPLPVLGQAPFHPRLRVFVLGDPRDTNVPWATQTPLAVRLRELGVAVELVHGEGSDAQRHALSASTRRLGALCAREVPTPAILETAAQGLKG